MIGLGAFVAAILASRLISEKAMAFLDEGQKLRLLEGFSRFRAYFLLPVIGIILFYYGGMKLFPRHAGNVSIAGAALLVAYVVGANMAIFRKLKSLEMPMAYVKRVVLARALLYLSLAALICFFAVSQGSL